MSGTTTVLFTDLADSTSELLARLGDDGYATWFARHARELGVEVERHRGRVTKLLGDGVLALFGSAYDGVCAAVEMQRVSELAGRSDGGVAAGLRVGLHVGEVVDRDDDVFGTTIVVASRLCDSARPGEVVVSQLVQLLIGNRPEISFRPMGERKLDGIADPVAVSAVEWQPYPERPPTRVVVADDAPLIRAGLVRLLTDAGFDVLAEAGDSVELLERVVEDPPDLVITDIRMPPSHRDEGLQAAAEIRSRFPEIGVVVLSQHIEARAALDLFDGRPAGIGYLLKERVSDVGQLESACREVAAGGSVVDPLVAEELMRRRRRDRTLARLTDREREVLSLMAQGRSNRAIADDLVVGTKTIETHVRSIFQKLDLDEAPEGHRRVQAVVQWLQQTDDRDGSVEP